MRALLLGLGVLVVHFASVRVGMALYGVGAAGGVALACLALTVTAVAFLGEHGGARGRWVGLLPLAAGAFAAWKTPLDLHGWAAWAAFVVAGIARATLPPPAGENAGAAWTSAALGGLFAVLVPSVAAAPLDTRYLAWAGAVAASTWACALARTLDATLPADHAAPGGDSWALRRRQVPLQLAMAVAAVLAVALTSRLSTSWTPLGPVLSAFLLARPLTRRLAENGRPVLPAVLLSAAGIAVGVTLATVPS
jgi:hypothetical protein